MGRLSLFLRCIFTLALHRNLTESRKTRLTWSNGIAYNLDHMVVAQVEISKYFGGKNVEFCHNPTSMEHEEDLKGYLTDLSQAGQQKLGMITEEVDSLVEHLQDALKAVGKNGIVIHIAHSQGALITSLASKKLSTNDMGQIEVLTFGGAAALRKTPKTPFKRCINYYAVNDPLLMVVPSAAQALRSGLVADDEFCFLAPRCGDPILDHDLCGPTYGQALQWEGDRFQRIYISPITRAWRAVCLILFSLLDPIYRGVDSFIQLILQPYLRFCAFSYRRTLALYLRIEELLVAKLIKPTVLIIAFIVDWINANIRRLRGEEKYQPVSSMLDSEELQ
jgi:hypothetical protein